MWMLLSLNLPVKIGLGASFNDSNFKVEAAKLLQLNNQEKPGF
jgi:hypothetical protein